MKSGTIVAGRYRIERMLGVGASGHVYAATHTGTHGKVALKFIQNNHTTHPDRLTQEVRIAASLSHRNVVRAYDVFEEGNHTIVVFELCEGSSLSRIIKLAPLSPSQAVAIVLGLLDGVGAAHTAGILHRDIKPQNIVLALDTDGFVIPKLLDFGIAKDLNRAEGITVTQQAIGTPKYMAPEQIRAEKIGPESDIFAIGAVLFECITGTSPFEAESTVAALAAVLEREVLPDERIPPELWMVIARALSKRRYERYPSCAEFSEDLKRTRLALPADIPQLLRDIPRPPPPDFGTDDDDPIIEPRSQPRSAAIDQPAARVVAEDTGLSVELPIAPRRWPALAIGATFVLGGLGIALSMHSASKLKSQDMRTLGQVSMKSAPLLATSEVVPLPPSTTQDRPVGADHASRTQPKHTAPKRPASGAATVGVARTPGF